MSAGPDTTGAVLMTYGAPRDDADLPRYLSAVRGGRPVDDALVQEMRRRYAAIGGSPLIRITQAQATALETALGPGYVAVAGMRFSEPTIGDAVRDAVSRGASRIVGIVMSPQWSPRLMGGYGEALSRAAADEGVDVHLAGAWHQEPEFIASLAQRIVIALRDSDAPTALVLTAHSLPKRVFETEPEYIAQLRETGEIAARTAGIGDWHWAFQDAGHTKEEWLRPDLTDIFPTLAASGAREVLVAPVQFLADHLEVLYDLDVAAGAQAREAGLRYRRIAMPNTDPAFVRALAGVVRRTLAPTAVS